MLSIATRLAKLESVHGKDDLSRWLKSATEEEISARINELDQNLRNGLEAEGVDCAGLSSEEICAIVAELEANGGERPAELNTIRKNQ